MDPMLILDDKSKEKALAEEMKKKYGIDRGTRGIIIKWINDTATQLGENILACKLLRKFRKDEVPVGVIIVATQCAEGTFMSWAPYLSNLFQIDCKYAQEAGTEFHYSWLLTWDGKNFHRMERIELHHLLYHTTSRRSKISRPEIRTTAKHKRGEWNLIRRLPMGDTGSHQLSMENKTRGCRTIRGHR